MVHLYCNYESTEKKDDLTAEFAECAENFFFSLFFFLSALSANSAVKKLFYSFGKMPRHKA